ncbi:MAG TPA: leucine-rich repeat domain-containing protein, partial [Bacteroidia bacterium]|nr:leucine-rich repeat domain-containing protein [Bacteroidia bacterium]
LKHIYYFPQFDSISALEVAGNDLVDIGEVAQFPDLQVLDLSNNQKLKSLSGIEKSGKLEYLSINDTDISDYSPLLKMKNLKKLVVSNMTPEMQDKLKQANANLEIETAEARDSDW